MFIEVGILPLCSLHFQQGRFEDYIPEDDEDDKEFLDGFFGTVSSLLFVVTALL